MASFKQRLEAEIRELELETYWAYHVFKRYGDSYKDWRANNG